MQSPNFLICEIASIHLKEHNLLENLQYTYHTKSYIQYKTTREPSQALPWTQSSTCHSPKIHRAIYSLICPSCVLCLVFIMPCIGSNGLYTVSSLCKFPCVSTALLPFHDSSCLNIWRWVRPSLMAMEEVMMPKLLQSLGSRSARMLYHATLDYAFGQWTRFLSMPPRSADWRLPERRDHVSRCPQWVPATAPDITDVM